jgi:hypothetical protein
MKKNNDKDSQIDSNTSSAPSAVGTNSQFHQANSSSTLQNERDLQDVVKFIVEAEMLEEDGDQPRTDLAQKIFEIVAAKEVVREKTKVDSVFLGILSKCYISSHEVHITVKDNMTHFKASAAIPEAFIKAREFYRSHREQSTLAILVYTDHLEVLSSSGKTKTVPFE